MKKSAIIITLIAFMSMVSGAVVIADVHGQHPVKSKTIDMPTNEEGANVIEEGEDQEEHIIRKEIEVDETDPVKEHEQ